MYNKCTNFTKNELHRAVLGNFVPHSVLQVKITKNNNNHCHTINFICMKS